MSTNVDFSAQEIAELQALTNCDDPKDAIRAAAAEFVRYRKRQELRALSGKVQMEENWIELEAAELKNDPQSSAGSH
jgi:hypothetical protein